MGSLAKLHDSFPEARFGDFNPHVLRRERIEAINIVTKKKTKKKNKPHAKYTYIREHYWIANLECIRKRDCNMFKLYYIYDTNRRRCIPFHLRYHLKDECIYQEKQKEALPNPFS